MTKHFFFKVQLSEPQQVTARFSAKSFIGPAAEPEPLCLLWLVLVQTDPVQISTNIWLQKESEPNCIKKEMEIFYFDSTNELPVVKTRSHLIGRFIKNKRLIHLVGKNLTFLPGRKDGENVNKRNNWKQILDFSSFVPNRPKISPLTEFSLKKL